MVKRRIKHITKKMMNMEFYPEFFLTVGILMTLGTLIKLLGFADFSSDWFWFIAGLGLIAEGFIILSKKHRYKRNYVSLGN